MLNGRSSSVPSVLRPRLYGSQSQFERFNEYMRYLGYRHDQYARVKIVNLGVMHRFENPIEPEIRFCWSKVRGFKILDGEGDDFPLPSQVSFVGQEFPHFGRFSVLANIHANGQWTFDVLKVYSQTVFSDLEALIQ